MHRTSCTVSTIFSPLLDWIFALFSTATKLHFLFHYRSDQEIVGFALETLLNIMSTEPNLESVEKQEEDAELAKQFTEIFLNKPETVGILLDLLEVCQLKSDFICFYFSGGSN